MAPKWLQELNQKKILGINHMIIEAKIRLNIMKKQNKNDTGFREGGCALGSGRVTTQTKLIYKRVLTKTNSRDIVVRLGNRSFFYALF